MDLWPLTVQARRSLLDTFETLDDDQWATQSLCGEWSVREVAAHLVLAMRPPKRRYAAALVRARGNFDAANSAMAAADATQPVDRLLANYRAALDNRFAPPGWPAAAPLADIVMHTHDVCLPLKLPVGVAVECYEPIMGLLFSVAGTSFSRSGRPDVQWVATDRDWSHGSGDEVRGSIADLALAAGGRSERLDAIDGAGVDALRRWLA